MECRNGYDNELGNNGSHSGPAHAFHFMALRLVCDHQGSLKYKHKDVHPSAQYLFCAFSDATQLICWRYI